MTNFYKFALNNISNYLAKITEEQRNSGEYLTAFEIATVLGIIFCKNKEECLADLIQVQTKLNKG